VLVYKRRCSLEPQVIRVLGSEWEQVDQVEVYVGFFSMIGKNKRTWKYFWINGLINKTDYE